MRFVIIGGQLFGIGSERAEVFLVVLDNCIGNQVQGLLAQFFVAALQAEQAVTFGVGRRNVGKGQVFQAVFNNRVKLCRLIFIVFVISLGGNQVVDVGKGFVRLINSLEFFINSFNFCRGKRGVFLCTATGCRRGWQRKATGCQGLWRRVSEAAGSCVRAGSRGVCADGPGR